MFHLQGAGGPWPKPQIVARKSYHQPRSQASRVVRDCWLIRQIEATRSGRPWRKLVECGQLYQIKYSEMEEEQASGEIKFDIRATARHELKMQKFERECS